MTMPDQAAAPRAAPDARHVLGLDLIRFCAATMVVVFHLAYWSWAPAESLTRSIAGGRPVLPGMAGVTWIGWVGVEVFFVLSGFVIAYSAHGRPAAAFLRSRVLRLYPTAWVCATLTLLAVLLLGRAGAETPGQYLRTMALWVDGPWIDGVYWTLGIEVVFYALVFAALASGNGGRLGLVLGALAVWSGVFWLGLGIDRLAPGLLPMAGALHDLLASKLSAFTLLRHGCLFALGGLLWLCLCQRFTWWRAALIGLCIAAGLLETMDAARAPIAAVGDSFGRRAAAACIWLFAVAAIAAVVVGNRAIHARFGRHARTVKLLGLTTYPLYLLHDVIGAGVLRAAAGLGIPPTAALAAALTVVLALAWLVTRRLEPPVNAGLRWLLPPTRTTRPWAPIGDSTT